MSTPEAGRAAVVCGPIRWSRAELDARAAEWSRSLAGLPAGARVATLCRTGAEQIALFHACARSGLVLTPLSHRLRARELAGQLDDARPAVLLADPEHAALADAAALHSTHRPERRAMTPGPAAAEPEAATDADRPVLLTYTSGSTGHPRGVALSARNCAATNKALDGIAAITTRDVVLQLLPQFHVAGWTVLPLLALERGASLVVLPDFGPQDALDAIAEHGVTVVMGVPTQYRAMADADGFAGADLGSLRLAISGGEELPPRVLDAWLARGVPLCQGYGLTEAGPNVLCVPPSDVDESAGWCGLPYPGVQASLEDDGEPVTGPGRGELVVTGDGVSAGYWGRPARTGPLRTGDLAERDERGWYRILGRLDDVYVSGGENVAPAEVVRVLTAHPDVAAAAIIDVPDERWGRAGIAFVEAAPNATPDPVELRAYCRERLATFKVPARVRVLDRLPRTGAGKVWREALRELTEGRS
ncbi:long-chain-fatty-acid--CoA ligase [Actinorhabdospora filicis]|uniref:Long-chain-fatty-acid--CoA ligase n=1 Tax=Actinorhabdospora filicis TaxID=1785913 RepID=A0A9W6SJC7_9ACTN|nr:AMP-binding protein [Actinorhabdospora filicis]GLZ78130.1 long-chain-fatty-acid--CoA ligase [Actinorhabdospora filicis]